MKRYFIKTLVVCLAIGSSNIASAQNNLEGMLKSFLSGAADSAKSKNAENKDKGLLSSLTDIFSGGNVATKDKITGTWVYEEPAIVLTSDNALKNLGGKLASSTAEKKLKEKLEGYGIKKGTVTMTFDKDDNFTQTIKGKTLKGTYTVEDKNIVLKYSGGVSQIIGTTQLDGNSLLIVMDASKLLKYVNLLGAVSQNTAMKTATSLLGSMKGLECGLRLVKK